MCGLSGAAGSIGNPDKKYIEDMLVYNIPRGKDSTGIASVNFGDKDHTRRARALGTPYGDGFGEVGLFGLKAFDRVMGNASKLVISHNRAATKGAVSIDNQHPFIFEKLVGAHNGTLDHSAHRALDDHADFGTDSEAIFYNIDKNGLEATIEKLRGAWALTWYDYENGTINLLRNDQRNLHFVFSKSGKTLYWSSDYEPMMYALVRAKIDIGEHKPSLVPQDTWLSWKVPNMGQVYGEVTRKTVKGADPFPVVVHQPTQSRTGGAGYHGSNGPPPHSSWPQSPIPGLYQSSASSVPKPTDGVSTGIMYDKTLGTWVPYPRASVKIENGITITASTPQSKQLMIDRINKIREERFEKQHGRMGTAVVMKYTDFANKVFFSKNSNDWLWYNYEIVSNEWKLFRSDDPPPCLPFRLIDIDAGGNHNFFYPKMTKKERKKGEGRKVMYKGYEGNLLPQAKFLSLMEDGCLNCQRKPTWGNIVRFLSHDHFLCEHCVEMPNVIQYMGLAAQAVSPTH